MISAARGVWRLLRLLGLAKWPARYLLQHPGVIDELAGRDMLTEIAQHIEDMSRTLSEVVPYLASLSEHMDAVMQEVTTDIVETLGDMQFQDINRQLLEQINHALGSLSTHFAQLYQLIDGRAPPPPMALEELMQVWTSNYVMHSQRVAHVLGSGGSDEGEVVVPDEAQTVGALELSTTNGPRIELF